MLNTYSTHSSVEYLRAYRSSSGEIYYGGVSGSDSIFRREDIDDNTVWAKVYPSFVFYTLSFVVSPKEDSLFVVEEGNSSRLLILQISTSTGLLESSFTR